MAGQKKDYNIAIAKQDRLIRDVLSFLNEETSLRISKERARQDYGTLKGPVDTQNGAPAGVKVWEFDVDKTLADVDTGKLQLAIIGRDKLEEFSAAARAQGEESDIVMVQKLPVSECTMIIAVPEEADNIAAPRDLAKLETPIVATRYPSLTREWLVANAVDNVGVVEYNKSVEAAIPYGDAGAIADITQTGQSLRDNFLRKAFGILESSACIITSRKSLNDPQTEPFIKSFCEAMRVQPALVRTA